MRQFIPVSPGWAPMKRKLRTGFTTGTAAAAATKGALRLIVEGKKPAAVQIRLLTGDCITIPVHLCHSAREGRAECSVIKDAGDDPDVTHKAEIGARVMLTKSKTGQRPNYGPHIIIRGGKGVGRVTKPGLEVPPGQPAINPGPRQMITEAIHDVLGQDSPDFTVSTEIFVPRGQVLAEKTLNARLGILGGISILGTTGIVRPMSHDAFIATIKSALSVARAAGLNQVVLTTGRRSERYAQIHWPRISPEAFIQIGDFFKMSLQAAAKRGFDRVTLAVFFGKALKMAQGVEHTHAAKSALTMSKLAEWAHEITSDKDFTKTVLAANTARHAFDLIGQPCPEVIFHVGRQIVESAKKFAGTNLTIRSVIFDYKGKIFFDSDNYSAQENSINR
ncbi:Cobalt-precorrin-5B (C1)-methyltransferase (EC [Olavius sp. associated proteobacterium Delta 1]|nr:Cobalt-precorrin-5B (C1)-methyltransferase (EC [Olavius sp. associated proteobacterium Delta 1]